MEQAVALFEQACQNFQSPSAADRQAAQQLLLSFRQSPLLIPACQYILQNSQDFSVLFQAAVALREGALQRWQSYTQAEKSGIQNSVLQFALLHASNQLARSVVRTLAGSLAVFLKREWGDMSQQNRRMSFEVLENAVGSVGSLDARRMGLQVLTAIVTEFSPSTATPLSMSWQYHDKCRASLEADFLKEFYGHASAIAREAVQSKAVINIEDGGTCSACIELLCAILSWDFDAPNRPLSGSTYSQENRPANESLFIKPGKSWCSILFAPGAIDWAIELLASLMAYPHPDEQLPRNCRQYLVLVCSVVREVFPKDAQGEAMKVAYLQRILGAIIMWIHPADRAAARANEGHEEELTDACRALLALARGFKAQELMQASSTGESQSVGICQSLCNFLMVCLNGGGWSDGDLGGWQSDCTDMALEALSEIARPEYSLASVSAELHPDVVQTCKVAFEGIAHAAIRAAAAEAHEDDDDDGAGLGPGVLEEKMIMVAQIARAAPLHTIPFLTHSIQETVKKLLALQSSGQDVSEVLEVLVWLVQMSGFVMADSGEGETPMIPLAIAKAGEEGKAKWGQDPVEVLCRALVELGCLCLKPESRTAVSPRLMEISVWCLSRWSDTYLLPSEKTTPSLETAFGANGDGPHILEALCGIANVCLAGFPGETQLQTLVCRSLLPTITKRKETCKFLVSRPSWQQLFTAFSAQQEAFRQLGEKLHRSIAQALCSVADWMQGQDARNQYIGQLMGTLSGELSNMCQRHDLTKLANRPDVTHRVCCMLESLRGIERGARSATKCQSTIFSTFLGLFQPLLHIQTAFKHDTNVTYLLLRFAGELVETHVVQLDAGNARILCEWVLQLLKVYSHHNLGAISVQSSKVLLEEHHAEQCRDLRALLILVARLTDRDLVDFGHGKNSGDQLDVVKVVLVGLDIIIPLMDEELLKFPKLCHEYFDLLSHLLEVYPEKVVELPPEAFIKLMNTLEFGMLHSESAVVRNSMEALAGLMKFHCTSIMAGKHGLSHHSYEGGESVVVHFLKVIFQLLLLEDRGRDGIDTSAGALLPMMLSESRNYRSICFSVLPSDSLPKIHETLDKALTSLVQIDGNLDPLSRPGRNAFRSNLYKFVGDVRGVIKTH